MLKVNDEFVKSKAYTAARSQAEAFLALNPEYNSSVYTVLPGFCDVHVHFREPGFSYKETISTGSAAAAHGGVTAVCTMPNLNPVPDCLSNLKVQTDLIKRDATVNIYPYGSLTVGQKGEKLADMESMAEAAVAFSDDGKGIQSEELMLAAMKKARSLGKIIAAHCEDNSLLKGGYIHDGVYAATHSHNGICSESEWKPIERDLNLVRKTGCSYHVCHISCFESVELIRKAKAEGLDVSCETAPHYLLLDENDLSDDGRFKMNPPLRSRKDREALISGIADGTIDMIATDHAPHSFEEKSKGLAKSVFGVVGIENSFALLYTYLVKKGVIGMEKLLDLMAINPRKRFGIPVKGDFSLWRLDEETVVDSKDFLSAGKLTPFEGTAVSGRCYLTVCNGKPVYKYIREEL